MRQNSSLIIDCCLDYLEIGLISNDLIIKTKFLKLNKNLTNILVEFIDLFLKENNIKKTNLEKLYLINGPGSFTSVKLISIFSNVFKTISNNINLYCLDSLSWNNTSKNEIVCIDAKSNYFYVGGFIFNKPYLTPYDSVYKFKNNKYYIYIYDISSKKEMIKKWNFNKNKFIKKNFVRPIYLKPAVWKL